MSGKRNKKVKKRARVIAVNIIRITVIAVIIAAAAVFIWQKSRAVGPSGKNMIPVDLYFRDAATLEWKTETRQIKDSQQSDIVAAVLDELVKGPKSSGLLASAAPEFSPIEITRIVPDSGAAAGKYIAELSFPDAYNDAPPAEQSDCVCSIVWSLTGLDFIDGARFFSGGQELFKNSDGDSVLNRDNVALAPATENVKSSVSVTLYFADEAGMGLVAETRDIERDMSQPLETYIINAMIAGPATDGLVRLIPKDTKVSTYRDNSTCFVDLSSEFLNNMKSEPTTERLAVASIVNALIDNNYKSYKIYQVQILINGDKATTSDNGVDLSMPFERIDDAMLDSATETDAAATP